MKKYLKYNLNNHNATFIANRIVKLPSSLQKKINIYTSLNKQQQRIDGLELLQEAILDFELDTSIYNLNTIQYSEKGKPFFDDKVAFSVAYTDSCSVLVFSKAIKVGVDIEKRKPINVLDYKDCFTPKEWETILSTKDKELQFYKLWTRKEAVAKAIGLGMFMVFNELEVLNDVVVLEQKWAIETEVLSDDYILSAVEAIE